MPNQANEIVWLGRFVMKGTAALKKDAKTDSWRAFQPGEWSTSINVRDFIVRNVASYAGDEKFLAAISQRTKAVWAKLQPYFQDERKKGVLAVDAKTPSTLLAHQAGYIDSVSACYACSGAQPGFSLNADWL